MAGTTGFFNAVREYDAEEFARYMRAVASSGYAAGVLNNLAVTAGPGLAVTMDTGLALNRGYWRLEDAARVFPLSTAHATLPRIDRLVCRVTISTQTIDFFVKAGTPNASPVAPSLTQTSDVNEWSLGRIAVAASAGTILGADLTDERPAVGPAVHDMLTGHSSAGLTTGQVLQATGSTTFAWQTLALAAFGTRAKNTALLGPASGADATPTFRTIQSGDIASAGVGDQQLVNGGLETWQRGAGAFTANNAFTADRWQIVKVSSDTVSVTRDGGIQMPNSAYSLKVVFTLSGGGGASGVRQYLAMADGYYYLRGGSLSVRGSVRCNQASAARLYVTVDGTGGTTTYSAYHSGGSTFEDLDVPNVAIPADSTFVYVGLALGVSCTAYLDNVMAVQGAAAAPYRGLHPVTELLRCQRYYEVIGGGVNVPTYQVFIPAGNDFYTTLLWKVAKGGTPTVTKNGTWGVSNAGQPTVDSPTVDGCRLLFSNTSGVGQTCLLYANSNTVTVEWNP